jgi:hypothetical protein
LPSNRKVGHQANDDLCLEEKNIPKDPHTKPCFVPWPPKGRIRHVKNWDLDGRAGLTQEPKGSITALSTCDWDTGGTHGNPSPQKKREWEGMWIYIT